MVKIGRNAPCPCMSDKKYKRCCSPKIYLDKNIQMQILPEHFVVNSIINSSKQFKKFYNTERKKINFQFNWALNTKMKPGTRAQCHRYDAINTKKNLINSSKCYIVIRQAPAENNYQISIAHELVHFILDSEGYPSIGSDNKKYFSMINSILDMLQDPIVHRRLIPYGFDMKKYLSKSMRNTLKSLKKKSNSSPIVIIIRLSWIFDYVKRSLEWESVFKNKVGNELIIYFNKKFPDIAEEGNCLLDTIKIIGIETPKQQMKLIPEIIQKNNLLKDIYMFNYTNGKVIKLH